MNKLMRGISYWTLAAALAVPVFAAGGHNHGSHDHGAAKTKKKKDGVSQGRKVKVKGEVIDMSCYMAHKGKGPKHQKCAKSCILGKSLPVGLLTKSGKVYLLVEDHGKVKPYQQVKELAAERVEVKGKKFLRGGMEAIAVSSVRKIK